MGVFEQFPYANMHEMNLEWLLKKMKELDEAMETFKATESLKFADPIIWDITTQYEKSTIVLDPTGNAYLSLQAVPTGVQLNNGEDWLEIFNFTAYTRTANQNLTINTETNTTRATDTYAVDDWLIWNDVLYKVTAAIAIDDAFIVAPAAGSNIVHFTVEDFIKAFITYATGLINQYKNDIDASELAYRQQLAQDIASTTASLQAQLNAAISGATVDSEVINARVGVDGTIYPTLGDAIRTQIGDINDTLYNNQIVNKVNEASRSTGQLIDLMNTSALTTAYITSDIYIVGNNAYRTYLLPCTPSTKYTYTAKAVLDRGRIVTFPTLPSNGDVGTVITSIQGKPADFTYTFETPADASYIAVYFYNANITTTKTWDEVITDIKVELGEKSTNGFLTESIIIDENSLNDEIYDQIETAYNAVDEVLEETGQLIDINSGNYLSGFIRNNGIFNTAAQQKSYYLPCEHNTTYTISTKKDFARGNVGLFNAIPANNDQGTYITPLPDNDSYTFTTGSNDNYIVIYFYNSNYDPDVNYLDFIKCIKVQEGDFATQGFNQKSIIITDNNLILKKHLGYGVKWNISDNDDLGERCYAAKGLKASVAVGSTGGYSDFDNIYPWSEMKRCNITTNANGAKIVTYEGESGFALNGTNGDVYVRIPKFSIVREIRDGYEYRIIDVPGAPIHEAFIEDGKELDEIFVSAFEGCVISGALHSYSGKIPTANMTGADFLTAAKTNNLQECSLYDMRSVDALWSLIVVEFGCRNTNHIFGYGYADYYQPINNGLVVYESASNTNTIKVSDYNGGAMTDLQKYQMPVGSTITICDTNQLNVIGTGIITSIIHSTDYSEITFSGSPVTVDTNCFVGSAGCITNLCESSSDPMTYHTGIANFVANGHYGTDDNVQNPIRYRYIENFIGSLWQMLPDVTFHNLQAYVCKNMHDYEFDSYSGAYKPYGKVLPANSSNGSKYDVPNTNYWITQLLDDTFAKSLLFAKAYDLALTSKKAFGGYYYLSNSDAVHIANGGGFDHLWRSNILTQRAWINPTQKWYLYGARLIRKMI